MRLFLFVAVLLSLPFILWKCSSQGDGIMSNAFKGASKLGPNSSAAASSPDVPDSSSASPSDSSSLLDPVAKQKEIIPFIVRTYRFETRVLPNLDSISTQLNKDCRILADPITQCIAVSGPMEAVTDTIQYFRQIDQPTASCAISCWVVFVDRRASKGFDFTLALADVLKASFPSNLSATLGAGALSFTARSSDIEAALGIIADGSTVEVIQRPQVVLVNGVKATIESLSEVPLPNSVLSNGYAQSSVTYRKVGLSLSVVPVFIGESRLRLAVNQTNGLIGSTVEISGSQVPVIETQSVDSSVQIDLGESILLGGVTTSRKRTTSGILHSKVETVSGVLYVIISTHPNYPKAHIVNESLLISEPVPLVTPPDTGNDWILKELLPKKGLLPTK